MFAHSAASLCQPVLGCSHFRGAPVTDNWVIQSEQRYVVLVRYRAHFSSSNPLAGSKRR
jgi:hypothetical protein